MLVVAQAICALSVLVLELQILLVTCTLVFKIKLYRSPILMQTIRLLKVWKLVRRMLVSRLDYGLQMLRLLYGTLARLQLLLPDLQISPLLSLWQCGSSMPPYQY